MSGDPIDKLSATLEELIVALGSGVARSQAALDRHSIEVQREVLQDPLLAAAHLEATWYQIPSAEMEVKLAFAVEEKSTPATGAVPPKKPARVWVQPVNARYANQFSFQAQLASTVKLTLTAVPPPGAEVRPLLSEEEVRSASAPHLSKDTGGNLLGTVAVNFEGTARRWYVVQSDQVAGETKVLVRVEVDDATGAAKKLP